MIAAKNTKIVSVPDISDEEFELVTEEFLDNINNLAVGINPELTSWVTDVLAEVQDMGKQERATFLHALQLADLEIQVAIRSHKKMKHRNTELLMKLDDLTYSINNTNNNTKLASSKLLERVTGLEEEIERLHKNSLSPVVEALRNQVAQVMDLTQMEKSLLFHALAMDKQAAEDDFKILEDTKLSFDPAEIKAIKNNVRLLGKHATQYRLRADHVRDEKKAVMLGIGRDIDSYAKLAQEVIPSKVMINILKWGTFLTDESKVRSGVEADITMLREMGKDKTIVSSSSASSSPRRSTIVSMPTSLSSSSSSATPSTTVITPTSSSTHISDKPPNLSAVRAALVQASQSQNLEEASVALQHRSHLKLGAAGSMPPAPAKSVLNVNNITVLPLAVASLDFDNSSVGSTNSRRSGGGGGGVGGARAASKTQKMRQVAVAAADVNRGGLVGSSSTSSLVLPAIGMSKSQPLR